MTTDSLNVKVTADVTNYSTQMENAKKKTTEFGDSVDKAAKETKNDFTPSVKEAAENLVKFGDTAGQAAKKTNDGFSSIKSTIVSLGIGSLIKTSLTDAMNAVESESLFETSMGGFAQQARDWSINLSKNLGLDEYALRKNVGTLYNMTTSMGLSKDASYELSTGLVALGEDMASFYNLSSEEAFTKLRSGLTGEAEPLKALGILINEQTVEQYAYATGIAKTGEKLTEQQKVLARYQAILAQTTNAQGDLARTLDSPANQMRIMMNDLKAASIEFGTALMPVVQVTLPIFRQVIADIKPVAVDVANGIALLSSGMGMLENPAVRTIAYVGAVVGIMNKLKLAVGGPLSAILLLGSVLTWLVGKFGETEQKTAEVIDTSMQAATISTDEAVTSADNLKKKYKEVGETVKGLTVPFDELTKASGGSKSTLGSTLVSGEDVENAETLNSLLSDMQKQTIDIAVPEIEIPEIEVPDIMPELDISGIDWNVIKENFAKWVGEQDWNAAMSDIGTGFISVMEIAFTFVDGLFGTHFADWYEDFNTYWADVGAKIYYASNPTDEGLKALDLYEKENGNSAWSDFYDLYKSGVAPEKAFEQIYTTPNLKKGFLAASTNSATRYIKEWEGLSQQQLATLLNPKKGVDDLESQSFRINDNSIMGITGNLKALVYNSFADAQKDVRIMDGITAFNGIKVPELEMEIEQSNDLQLALQSLNKNTVNVPQSSITSPITNADILTSLRSSAPTAAAAPIQLVNTIILDGEEMKNWTQKVQADRNDETNGRQ